MAGFRGLNGDFREAALLLARPQAIESHPEQSGDQLYLGGFQLDLSAGMLLGQDFLLGGPLPRIGKNESRLRSGGVERSIRLHGMKQGRNETFVLRGEAGLAAPAGMGFPGNDDGQNAAAAPELLETAHGLVHMKAFGRTGRADHDQAAGLLQRLANPLAQAGVPGLLLAVLENGVNAARNDFRAGIGLADEIRRNGKGFQNLAPPVAPAHSGHVGCVRAFPAIVLLAVAEERPICKFVFGHNDSLDRSG